MLKITAKSFNVLKWYSHNISSPANYFRAIWKKPLKKPLHVYFFNWLFHVELLYNENSPQRRVIFTGIKLEQSDMPEIFKKNNLRTP